MSIADQTFSENLRFIRKAQGLSVRDIADRAKLPVERVRAIDSGEAKPYLLEALRIAKVLGTTVETLADGIVTKRELGVFHNIASTLPQNITEGGKK